MKSVLGKVYNARLWDIMPLSYNGWLHVAGYDTDNNILEAMWPSFIADIERIRG